jgi:hypothetical protein
VSARRWLPLLLAVAAVSACGATGAEPDDGPHVPRSEDERLLEARYREFVRALERKDTDGICEQLDDRLAESYGCAARFRLPRELRRLEVRLTDVFAAVDPSVPDEIQISSQTTRKDGYSLILFFRRGGDDRWRVNRAMIGGYG